MSGKNDDKSPHGSCIPMSGGETPLEQNPESKFCIEKNQPLSTSLMWEMLKNYYKKMAIEAWTQNYVPSFVTSNSRLAQTFSNTIFGFMKDWYRTPGAKGPVYILELGAGHGRFTYLVIKHLLKFKDYFKALGMPEQPFLYIFSDVAEANINFCSNHTRLKELTGQGWLDFAHLDGNIQPINIHLRIKDKQVSVGSPVISIANYVLDSLLTDAFKIEDNRLYKALVSIYSPQVEKDPTNPDIMTRMSVTWEWEELDLIDNKLDLNGKNLPEYLDGYKYGESISKTIDEYINLQSDLSFVLPIGSLKFIQALNQFTNSNMLLLIGDKGYPSCDEFYGIKDPHIAIHGSASFMVNLDSLMKYVKTSLKGHYVCTPWRDAFQLLGLWGHSDYRNKYPQSVTTFLEDIDNASPDSLILWQRDMVNRMNTTPSDTYGSSSGDAIKTLLSLLRYGAHDADIFWTFRSQFIQWSVPPFTNTRTESDLVSDMKKVYDNWYKLREREDIPDICGHICMKIGRCKDAIFYMEESVKHCPECVHAATYINMASCYKVIGKMDKAIECCNKALQLSPDYAHCHDLKTNLTMCQTPTRTFIIGCGPWMRYESLQLLIRDRRVDVVGILLEHKEDLDICQKFLKNIENFEIVYGMSQLDTILARKDIESCVVDLKPDATLVDKLVKVWKARKHTLTKSPAAYNSADLYKMYTEYIENYKDDVSWHIVDNTSEDAFLQAKDCLAGLGTVYNVSISLISDSGIREPTTVPNPLTSREFLSSDMTKALGQVQFIMDKLVSSLSIHYTTPTINEKTARDAPVLHGWARFEDSVTANVMASRHLAENTVCFIFHCANGTLTLKNASSAWQIQMNPHGGNITEIASQCIGNQNNHDKWLNDIFIKSGKYRIMTTSPKIEKEISLSLNLSTYLFDCAVIDAILSSTEKAGAVISFTHKPSKECIIERSKTMLKAIK